MNSTGSSRPQRPRRQGAAVRALLARPRPSPGRVWLASQSPSDLQPRGPHLQDLQGRPQPVRTEPRSPWRGPHRHCPPPRPWRSDPSSAPAPVGLPERRAFRVQVVRGFPDIGPACRTRWNRQARAGARGLSRLPTAAWRACAAWSPPSGRNSHRLVGRITLKESRARDPNGPVWSRLGCFIEICERKATIAYVEADEWRRRVVDERHTTRRTGPIRK